LSVLAGKIYDLLIAAWQTDRMDLFDAYIQIGPAQCEKAELPPDFSKTIIRYAVLNAIRQAPGAERVDVTVTDQPPASLRPWVTVCPKGRPVMPNTPQWKDYRLEIETLIEATLAGLAPPAA
jgi:hypothetical protein